MARLRNAIIRNLDRAEITMSSIKAHPKSSALVEKLGGADLTAPNAETLFIVGQRIIKKLFQTTHPEELTKKEIRIIPWIIWDDANEHRNNDLLETYYKYSSLTLKKREISAAISAYLDNFSTDKPQCNDLGRIIKNLLKETKPEEFIKWKNLSDEHNLFTPNKAVEELAKYFIKRTSHDAINYEQFWDETQIPWQDSATNIASCVFKQVCINFSEFKQKSPEHLFYELLDWGQVNDNQLRYPIFKKDLAHALLKPWLNEAPEENLKKDIQRFILDKFDDPRIHPGKWATIDQNAQDVMKWWLSRQSFEQFFKIVDRLNKDERWPYRKAFWSAYLNKCDHMEAWFALNENAQRKARQMFPDDNLSFGMLAGSGSKQNEAVVIMKIDNLIITEWNDTGAARVYSSSNTDITNYYKAPPKLYNLIYYTDDLMNLRRGEEGWFAHLGAENYRWQRDFALYIRNHTNIKMNEAEYRI